MNVKDPSGGLWEKKRPLPDRTAGECPFSWERKETFREEIETRGFDDED